MGESGYKFAAERRDWKDVCEATRKVYMDVLERAL